jgi:uridine kinase
MDFKVKVFGEERTYSKKISLLEMLGEEAEKKEFVAAKVNNRVRSLDYEVYYDAEVEFLTLSDHEAMKMYEASLRYVIAMAFASIYPNIKIRFAYNVSRCISIHILTPGVASNTAMLIKINHEIERIVAADYPLKRIIVTNEEAAKIYEERGFDDKLEILAYRPEKTVHIVECNGYINYMYTHLVPSTGYVKYYKLRLYTPGILVQYPRSEEGGKIPALVAEPTYGRTLKESHDWAKIVGVDTVARINDEIKTAGPIEFINVCEQRINRQLTELGQLIEDDISDIRLICIAGPSSSGKTTFANRLRIELLSRGIRPVRISTDDYYVDREKTPLGDDGQPDYESIDALDLETFNQNMLDLISGDEVSLPKFDFESGKRVKGRTLKLSPEEPIIIEGIHALNDQLTAAIPRANKFKIFISPQAQINLDDHNPVSLTDLRLIRRLVRDRKFRGTSGEDTLRLWPKVRQGEFKWIYSTQEGSDYVFNSFMPYELPLMKKYAMPLLQNIDKESPSYPDAARLTKMLKYFIDMSDEWVPSNSLMREFIGGSCFEDV